MTISALIRRSLALALCVVAFSAGAAETTKKSETAKEAAKSTSTDPRKSAREQIDAAAAKMVAEHQALAKQLKDASEAQRKEILAKLEEQKKNFQETMDALHKRVREEDRKRRQEAVTAQPKR